jgi:lipopolysaccharide heptosyltransferase II
MPSLHIYDPRERALVTAADRLFGVAAAVARPFRSRRRRPAPRRILLLRLERIGDLLMALPAMADVRAHAPDAEIDLIVGGWNARLASAMPAVTRVETLDARWLARDEGGLGLRSLLASARRWRGRRYDLAINFEPDVRSNLLLVASGAAWTAGYRSGGGGALLDCALDYDTRAHTTDNARRLVAATFGSAPAVPSGRPGLVLPESARAQAEGRLVGARGPLVGIHVSGGRAIKQWEPDRFAEVARRLIHTVGATIVLTGSPADRSLVESVRRSLPEASVIDVSGDLDLLAVGAILERLDLLVTGDTGPMHLAAAVATPIVAVFGPSDPVRYAPCGPHDRVVRVDLPCSPCNRIRRPPARCVGHTPDCLDLVSADRVFTAAMSVLDRSRRDTVRTGHATA